MGPRYYVDTSAYLSVLLGEKDGPRLQRELNGGLILSSSLLLLESTRALIRLSRDGVLSSADLQNYLDRIYAETAHFIFRDLTIDLCRAKTVPLVSTPRSLALAHLRTALWFHDQEPIARFVTLDATQRQAARELGLPV